MSGYHDDVDSPGYNDTNLGVNFARETREEKEMRKIELRISHANKEIATLQAENASLLALAMLGLWVLNTRDDGDCADLDGEDIQNKAIQLGLIAEVDAIEPCGDGCRCLAELGLSEFPTPCLQLTDKAKVLDK